jgi:hypothetical protein
MTRKTGALVLIVLALSVACLGVVLALRCECGGEAPEPVEPRVEVLTIGSGQQN